MNNSGRQGPETNLDYNALHWFALYTKSRHEKKVKELLDEKGIESYLPLKKEYHQWIDRKKLVEVPLIRGYVFVRISAKNSVFVLELYGAIRFIKFKDEMAPIPDFQIQALMQAMNEGIELKKRNYPVTGQDVEVSDGPMKGAIGKLVRIENENRFFITLKIPPCAFEVMINPELLKPYIKEYEKKTHVSIPLGI
ncbi:MAG: UpxY family transcription antiterminator [Candidatus Marinimicrobia bacterium]|nr:UpxY family transcription antiterminator [Candidatus Neomarinimicrobiota bacterium]